MMELLEPRTLLSGICTEVIAWGSLLDVLDETLCQMSLNGNPEGLCHAVEIAHYYRTDYNAAWDSLETRFDAYFEKTEIDPAPINDPEYEALTKEYEQINGHFSERCEQHFHEGHCLMHAMQGFGSVGYGNMLLEENAFRHLTECTQQLNRHFINGLPLGQALWGMREFFAISGEALKQRVHESGQNKLPTHPHLHRDDVLITLSIIAQKGNPIAISMYEQIKRAYPQKSITHDEL
ncbi:MAG: hypothetical protein B7X06_00780 [Verrucomicrobia bacterium 21-51-4]|nr:MAG: hypothetical protein B7X06_00780 [Verrucomicrobia bacterium 21-51-4]HQU08680.1 hypothetical protein [Opitutales bacterium]